MFPTGLSLTLMPGLSTYKELCAIASDMNKPDLIYKFMQLAKHNSMWTCECISLDLPHTVTGPGAGRHLASPR